MGVTHEALVGEAAVDLDVDEDVATLPI